MHVFTVVCVCVCVCASGFLKNLSTAMRQSAFQALFSWMFYLPLAFFIPPRLFYLHMSFNLIYQFFIHARWIGKLGPLEWVLNTPSHHRVHHGRNPRYLDRNYGGVLIVFDRLFGTFQEEDEVAAFGLVHPVQHYNLFASQVGHLQYMWQRIGEEHNPWDKWAVVWKGPGWRRGAPRLGFLSDVPPVSPTHRKFNPILPAGLHTYIIFNFLAMTALNVLLISGLLPLPIPMHYVWVAYFMFSLQSLSMVSDNSSFACHMEWMRLATLAVADLYFALSAAQWLPKSMGISTATNSNGKYAILWYAADSANVYTATHPIFILLRIITAASLVFMTYHIVFKLWKSDLNKKNVASRVGGETVAEEESRSDNRAQKNMSKVVEEVGGEWKTTETATGATSAATKSSLSANKAGKDAAEEFSEAIIIVNSNGSGYSVHEDQYPMMRAMNGGTDRMLSSNSSGSSTSSCGRPQLSSPSPNGSKRSSRKLTPIQAGVAL